MTQIEKKIQTEINGSWVDVFVDFISLWQALRLPLHGIFNKGTFHDYQHNKITGEDVANVDHGGTAVELENADQKCDDLNERNPATKNLEPV